MNKDWDHIAKIEKAINQKYGKEAIVNPNSEWSEAKEKEYLKQLKELSDKQRLLDEQEEKVEADGFLINKKLLTHMTAPKMIKANQLKLVLKERKDILF